MADIGDVARCSDVGVGKRKVDSVFLGLERRKKKRAHLLSEAQATQRKALQKKRPLEEASRKCQHDRATMHGYFSSSRNLENRGNLMMDAFGFIGACSEPAPVGVTGGEPAVVMALLDLRETPDALSLPQDHAVHGANPVVEPDLMIELSIPGVIPLTLDSCASMCSEDDPNVYIPDCILSSKFDELDPNVSDFAIDSDDDFVDLPTKRRKGADGPVEGAVKVGSKRWKRKYDLTRKYQIE